MPISGVSGTPQTSLNQPNDRRKRRRALISAPVRVRGVNVTDADNPDEVSTTLDVSRSGLLFLAENASFSSGMEVAVTFPYSTAQAIIHAEQYGRVARVFEAADGRRAVAIAFGKSGSGDAPCSEIVDASGRELVKNPPCSYAKAAKSEPAAGGPLILAVDADDMLRDSLKTYLANQGYNVIAVNNPSDAREVLKMFTPALLIAEVEGEGLPGFDLCAHVKSTQGLQRIPVVLTTSSAYPSDYSNAHSLGAVVCMAKPYKQERLGHAVRLLAPVPRSNEPATPADHPATTSSVPRSQRETRPAPQRRWRFRLP